MAVATLVLGLFGTGLHNSSQIFSYRDLNQGESNQIRKNSYENPTHQIRLRSSFLGVALEGEFFLLAAAFLAQTGTFSLPIVILIAITANCSADQVYYTIARARGLAWLEARFGRHKQYGLRSLGKGKR